jgi:hypothetical protein
MTAGTADTHATICFYMATVGSPSQPKTSSIRVAGTRLKIALSPISLAEVVYLVEKNRLPNPAYLRSGNQNPAALQNTTRAFSKQPGYSNMCPPPSYDTKKQGSPVLTWLILDEAKRSNARAAPFEYPSRLGGIARCSTIAVTGLGAFESPHLESVYEMIEHSRHLHCHHLCVL